MKKIFALLFSLLMVSAAYAQTGHKSKHTPAKKKQSTVARKGSSVKHKTASKHSPASGHRTAAKHNTSGKHRTAAGQRAPVKRNISETPLLEPNMRTSAYDSLYASSDTSVGAINFLLSIMTNELGKPYRLGSDGPTSFDCSGLINFAFSYIGISLPRTSRDIAQIGKQVLMKDLYPGDLLFFSGSNPSRRRRGLIGHLGCVYKVDSGKVYMIHSSREGVNITNISESEYYKKRLVCAKRIVATDSTKKAKK